MGEKALHKARLTEKRKVKVCNILSAKQVGIIFDATNPIYFETIKNLVKDLNHKKIEVTVLGYINHKDVPELYLYRKGFDFFTRNELNWKFIPESAIVTGFINKPFDILINLTLDQSFPIRYVASRSKAHFKVATFDQWEYLFDMTIDLQKEREELQKIRQEIRKSQKTKSTVDSQETVHHLENEALVNILINHLLHYLEVIRDESAPAA